MNKVIVITGAGGVLCSTIALALAKNGHHIAVVDLNLKNADTVATQIKDQGGTALAVQADVLDRESLSNARNLIIETLGTPDILINGAGGNHPLGTTTKSFLEKEDLITENPEIRTFFDLDMKGIEFVFNLNFIGTLLPTQVFSKDMTQKKGCSILNISSMNAFTPLTRIPAYSGAKAAVSNFTQWLAVHFAKMDIRVNAIAPGFFLTEQNRSLLTNANGNLTERGQRIIDQTPMGRFGNPEDLVATVLWLCGEGAAFVTGTVIPIDGGFSAYSGV